jgi:hypothetical protein
MSEHMITTLTIFEQNTKHGKAGESTKKVSVVLNKDGESVQNVQYAAWSRGPRGGYTNGMSIGFTLEEFDLLHTTINVLNYGLRKKTYEVVLNIDKPWDSVLRCNRCQMIINSTTLMAHRQTEQHMKSSEPLSA